MGCEWDAVVALDLGEEGGRFSGLWRGGLGGRYTMVMAMGVNSGWGIGRGRGTGRLWGTGW